MKQYHNSRILIKMSHRDDLMPLADEGLGIGLRENQNRTWRRNVGFIFQKITVPSTERRFLAIIPQRMFPIQIAAGL
jgi:hypothetical protein